MSLSSSAPFFQNNLRCTLVITQNCNLACDYCYAPKKVASMSLDTARLIVDFMFQRVPKGASFDVGFFGGEPFLEFGLLRDIVGLIVGHPNFGLAETKLSVTSNGTVLSDEMLDFLATAGVALCISCDGVPAVQNRFRHYANGEGSAALVERNIRRALARMPMTAVNAVYSPETLPFLAESVDYFMGLGVHVIHLSPNILSRWTQRDADALPGVFDAVAERYVAAYRRDNPCYISLLDSKIAVILQGGYRAVDRCKMGRGEYAFAPGGNVYPCERLVGSDDGVSHCLGNIHGKLSLPPVCEGAASHAKNLECQDCGIKDYCMNWCGCTNYHGTGRYDLVSAFTCASEKAAINAAYGIIQRMGPEWAPLSAHQVLSNFK
jgi:uncharacterized protein